MNKQEDVQDAKVIFALNYFVFLILIFCAGCK